MNRLFAVVIASTAAAATLAACAPAPTKTVSTTSTNADQSWVSWGVNFSRSNGVGTHAVRCVHPADINAEWVLDVPTHEQQITADEEYGTAASGWRTAFPKGAACPPVNAEHPLLPDPFVTPGN